MIVNGNDKLKFWADLVFWCTKRSIREANPLKKVPACSLSGPGATLGPGRTANADGFVDEIFIYAGKDLLPCRRGMFNNTIVSDLCIRFTMVPRCFHDAIKTRGSSKLPSNPRPRAVLKLQRTCFFGCC